MTGDPRKEITERSFRNIFRKNTLNGNLPDFSKPEAETESIEALPDAEAQPNEVHKLAKKLTWQPVVFPKLEENQIQLKPISRPTEKTTENLTEKPNENPTEKQTESATPAD